MGPNRPSRRLDFEIAIICALTIEADAVEALFDIYWDDEGPPYDKVAGDPNAYTNGAIGRHNVVLAHPSGIGKAGSSNVAANCHISYPNIKLAVVVGICGAVPFAPDTGDEILLGDVILSDGVVQYDLGRQLPERFVRKDTLLESLARPNLEIRALLGKLRGIRSKKAMEARIVNYLDVLRRAPELRAEYPGAERDWLFAATERHAEDGLTCEECGCKGERVQRQRLTHEAAQPKIRIGLVASGDTVMKSGEQRDATAKQEHVLAFEMEGAGAWDSLPCIIIKGACDYADSHKNKEWQRYAAATAAACMKAYLEHWVPSVSLPDSTPPRPVYEGGPWFLVPYTKNEHFVRRSACLQLQKQDVKSLSQTRVALFGLGGTGKTQISIAYAYWLRETHPEILIVQRYKTNNYKELWGNNADEI